MKKCSIPILGTWQGPCWYPTMGIQAVLTSIQGFILVEKPYHNEPGFEHPHEGNKRASEAYSRIIQHENIRVAVIGMMNSLELNGANPHIKEFIQKEFCSHFTHYVSLCKELESCDGKPIGDYLFHSRQGNFCYNNLRNKLETIMSRLNCERKVEIITMKLQNQTLEQEEVKETE